MATKYPERPVVLNDNSYRFDNFTTENIFRAKRTDFCPQWDGTAGTHSEAAIPKHLR